VQAYSRHWNKLPQPRTDIKCRKRTKRKSTLDTEQTNMTYKEDEPIETTHKYKENNLHHNDGNITN